MLDYLIQKGADVNFHGMKLQTIGFGMIHEGDKSKLKLLLDNGLNVNFKDTDGAFLMYIAVQNNNFEVLKMLD